MDALIAERFGMKVNINGTDCIVVESDFLAELGPVEGNGKNVVVFSGNVIPRRGDRVVLRGSEFTVTRIRRFNGKPQLTLEENNGGIRVDREDGPALEGFLSQHNGVKAFLWTPPYGYRQIKVVCRKWSVKAGLLKTTFTATFEQVIS